MLKREPRRIGGAGLERLRRKFHYSTKVPRHGTRCDMFALRRAWPGLPWRVRCERSTPVLILRAPGGDARFDGY
jgi:hypothetical protein